MRPWLSTVGVLRLPDTSAASGDYWGLGVWGLGMRLEVLEKRGNGRWRRGGCGQVVV